MAERIGIDPHKIETNIVIFDIAETGLPPADFLGRLKARECWLARWAELAFAW